MRPGGLAFGAGSRLLPASLPYRFFAAAALFQLLHYVLLAIAADTVPGFRGGSGPVLAAIHTLTLGVLVMTAIGASLQLLPVATRTPVSRLDLVRLCWWLYAPGVLLLTIGLSLWSTPATLVGAVATTAGIVLYVILLAGNLRRARGFGPVGSHAATALLALLVLTGLGLVLLQPDLADRIGGRGAMVLAHVVLAGYGFMGLLALGFSNLLLPMFALAPAVPEVGARAALYLALAALGVTLVAIAAEAGTLKLGAAGLGLAAAGLHIGLLLRSLRARMRRRLGFEFVLVFLAWAWLPVSLLLAGAWAGGWGGESLPPLFVFALLVGWLQTFLLAVLQRIVPFLASMHLGRRGGRPPLLSELTATRPRALHLGCHLVMQVAIFAGLSLEAAWLVRVGALAGICGAAAFVAYVAYTSGFLWRAGRGKLALRDIK